MCSEGLSVRFEHLVRIAVIRRQKHTAAHGKDLIDHLFNTFIYRVYCFDCCRDDARVPDHIAVCKVEDHGVIFARLQLLDSALGDFGSAHFGLKVVGCDFRGVDEYALFSCVGGFHAAVKEECDVRILFRFSNAQLFFTKACKVFAQRIFHGLLGECDLNVFVFRIVHGEADVYGVQKSRFSLECRTLGNDERILREGARDLACTVGAEIEEDDGVAFFDERDGFAVFGDIGGQDKFVRHACVIGSVQRGDRILRLNARSEREHVICLFDAIPVVVAVHRIVSAREGRKLAVAELFHFVEQLLYIVHGRGGRRVTAVQEGVDVSLGYAVALCHFKEGKQVRDVAVYAAVRQKPPQVQLFTVLCSVLHCLEKRGVLEEFAVLDLLGDLGKVLIDDAPRAHVEVSDLGIAHLSVGKSDGTSACSERCGRVFGTVFVDVLAAVKGNGVACARRCKTIAVHDDDRTSFFHMIPLNWE